MKKNITIKSMILVLSTQLLMIMSLSAEPFDQMVVSTWKFLSWQEKAQCGTSIAKAMVDIMRSSSQQPSLRPFFFWIITLADDGINLYNSKHRKDQEWYSMFWIIKDLLCAAKELAEEPSIDDLDLIDQDDYYLGGGGSMVSVKKIYPCFSPLIKMAVSLYCIIKKAPESHKERVIAQGVKSLIRCSRWYINSADKDKKSFETGASVVFGALNVAYLFKNMISDYPINLVVEKPTVVPKGKVDVAVGTDA